MLPYYLWLLLLATLGTAVDPWEINRNPEFFPVDPATGQSLGPQQDQGPATYYLDQSCIAAEHDLRPVIEEVIRMGREGFDRLKNNRPEFTAMYKRIFKISPEEDLVLRDQRVMRAFHRISGLIPAPNFESADIRIFCDNDESTDTIEERGDTVDPNNLPRWVPRPDNWFPPGPNGGPLGNGVPNSGLIFEEQWFMDRINLMHRNKGDAGVQDEEPEGTELEGETLTFAQWYGVQIQVQTNQNPRRETITVSDLALSKGATLLENLGSDIIKTQIDTYDILQSHTLFHEFCHSLHILGNIESVNEVYTWKKIDPAEASIAQKQGDSFAFLGLYALMNSRNIKINDAPSSDLSPLDPSQPVTKVKRSYLYSRRQTADHDLSLSTYSVLRRRAVPFIS